MKIPNNNKWYQSNRGDIYGSIWSSFNIDLTAQRDSGRGNVRLGRTLLGATSASLTNMGVPIAFRRYGNSTYAIAGTRVFKNGAALTSTWAEVSSTPTNFSNRYSDMEIFNNYLYFSEGSDNDIARYDGSSWTEIAVNEISASKPHMMCTYADRLYISGADSDDSIIVSMNIAQTVATLGNSNTMRIYDESRNIITFLRPVSNGIWIGTVNSRGGKGTVYFWNGEQQSANASYRLQSAGALAGVIKDDVLYIMDADGRLMAFNGGTFVEIDRLPIKENYLTYGIGVYNERWIHPNGMTVADDRILILIDNEYYTAALDGTIEENVPSGIWEWSEETGLYHKYALSHTPVSGAGGGSIYDWGQNRINTAGALNFIKQNSNPSNDNGTIFAGASVYTNATSTINGIFIDDLNDTVQKNGYLVTPRIYSDAITDSWQKIYIRHKKLLDSSDKIIVKYRTSEVAPTEATITWIADDTVTSTTDLSDYVVGDEMEVTQGRGGGKCAHITDISESGGTYTVVLDDTFINVASTGKARFQKWIKSSITNTQLQSFHEYPIDMIDTWIQFKICMQFTGENEIDDLVLVNQTHHEAS